MSIYSKDLLIQDQLKIKTICEQEFAITLNDWDSFTQHFSARELKVQQHWIQAGDICTELCFILEGLIRISSINSNVNTLVINLAVGPTRNHVHVFALKACTMKAPLLLATFKIVSYT